MKQVYRLLDVGYAITYVDVYFIELILMKLKIEDGRVEYYPYRTQIKNNAWAVTKFLNYYGGVNCQRHRDELSQYNKSRKELK